MAAKRFWLSGLTMLLLAMATRTAVVDKCTLDASGVSAIDLISGYQSHLINLFALDSSTKLDVLPATEKVPNKNLRIIYRIGEPNVAVFFIGVEYREADGKTEIEEYYQSQNLAKVAAFFDLEVEDKPIVCSNFQQDFATFADRYFAAVSPSLTQKSIAGTSVSVSLTENDSSDVAKRGFKFVTASALKGKNDQPIGTISGSGVAGGPASSVTVGGQAASAAVGGQTVSRTSNTQPLLGAANQAEIIQLQGAQTVAAVNTATAATSIDQSSKTASITLAVKQAANNIIPIVLEPADKVLIDYVANNFRLAYNFRIFRSTADPSTPTLTAQVRRRLRRSQKHAESTAH